MPRDLLRQVKLRAMHVGRKPKDVTAELLKRGLAAPVPTATSKPLKPRIEIQAYVIEALTVRDLMKKVL